MNTATRETYRYKEVAKACLLTHDWKDSKISAARTLISYGCHRRRIRSRSSRTKIIKCVTKYCKICIVIYRPVEYASGNYTAVRAANFNVINGQ